MRNVCVAQAAIVIAGLFLSQIGGAALAQTAAQTPPPAEQISPETPPAPAPVGEDWNIVSRSATRAYLADVNSIKTSGDLATITMGRVPLNPSKASDQSYSLIEMEYRCSAKQSREVAETDHDETGTALGRDETGETLATYNDGGLDAFVAAMVCGTSRAVGTTYPSIAAYIAAGRP